MFDITKINVEGIPKKLKPLFIYQWSNKTANRINLLSPSDVKRVKHLFEKKNKGGYTNDCSCDLLDLKSLYIYEKEHSRFLIS